MILSLNIAKALVEAARGTLNMLPDGGGASFLLRLPSECVYRPRVDFREVFSFSLVAFSAIFFVVDPMAAVPMFVTMTQGDLEEKKTRMAGKAVLVAGGVLIFFTLFGTLIFRIFGLTIAAFQIAGGILLLITALDMLQSKPSATRTSAQEIQEGSTKNDIAIVPLAMPMFAGPGSIATVMVLSAESTHWWQLIPIGLGISATMGIAYLCLRGASYIDRFFGHAVRAVFERVMGLILAALAVQFIINGVRAATH